MMTVPTGESVDTTHRSEEAVTTAVHSWADTVQTSRASWCPVSHTCPT